jgi:hypothetical protein
MAIFREITWWEDRKGNLISSIVVAFPVFIFSK